MPKNHGVEQQERLADLLIHRLLVFGDGDACGQRAVGDLFGNDGLRAAQMIRELRSRHAVRADARRYLPTHATCLPLIEERLAGSIIAGDHICICSSKGNEKPLGMTPRMV